MAGSRPRARANLPPWLQLRLTKLPLPVQPRAAVQEKPSASVNKLRLSVPPSCYRTPSGFPPLKTTCLLLEAHMTATPLPDHSVVGAEHLLSWEMPKNARYKYGICHHMQSRRI